MANSQQEKSKEKQAYRPVLGVAIVSLLLCGLFFPLLMTAAAQLMPYQANGEIVYLHGKAVGSSLIAQSFNSPVFFQPRSGSASGVDPDITLQQAYAQIPRIHDATGIRSDALTSLVNQKAEGTFWVFGSPYVNVLQLNLALIAAYPSEYGNFG